MHKRLGILNDCMPAACLTLAAGVIAVTVWRVGEALEDSHRVHEVREAVVASLVAEDAAFAAVAGDPRTAADEPVSSVSPTGLRTEVRAKVAGDRSLLRMSVAGQKDRRYEYECEVLPGSGPPVLGNPLSVSHASVTGRPAIRAWLRGNLAVRLDPMADGTVEELLEPAYRTLAETPGNAAADFTAHESIALLRLKVGTDREDFVIASGANGTWRPDIPPSGVRVVPGNLWIDRAPMPLRVELPSSLTIVVHGNFYLGRSVETVGPGRLVIVTRERAPSTRAGAGCGFVDLDVSGGWSTGDRLVTIPTEKGPPAGADYRGPVEGSGAIYLGLPGTNSPLARMDASLSLVSAGEVYVRANRATVRGALVVGRGVTWAEGCRLSLPGDALPNVEREPLPGFRRTGGARPGMLRRVR